MKLAKLVCTYIIVGAATAIGQKMIEALSDPYDRALLKTKFKNITNEIMRRP